MSEVNCAITEAVENNWPIRLWSKVNVALALSGGADSVALLRAVWHRKSQFGGPGKVSVIHVNHGLRGAESDADAAWCKQLCDDMHLPLTICSAKTQQRVEQDGDGIEAAARAERYQLMTKVAEATGARYLATAHTLDDQVETVLMRILRGSGLRGLSGIPRLRPLTPSLTLIRPLLECRRTEVEAYLAVLGQAYRSDQSNFENAFTRNRIRHELLPLLREQYHGEIDAVLLRLATQAEQTQRFLEAEARKLLAECQVLRASAELSLLSAPLAKEQTLIACEALRLAWRESHLPEQAMTHEWWQRVTGLCREPTVLNVPGNIRAEIVGDRLKLSW